MKSRRCKSNRICFVEQRRSGSRTRYIEYQKGAQAALLDYLHYTRNLAFNDAENMSKNSPHFLKKLLEKVGDKNDIGKSVSQYLRYSPINEFEPFYESLGLKPHEYSAILRRDLTFLCDDELLMENYKVLCNYGIERKNMGRIVKEASEVFWYEYGVLALKLEAYQKLGLSHCFVAKMVVCSPYVLTGNVNEDLIKVLQILRKGGIKMSLIEEHLSEKTSFNWSRLFVLIHLFHTRGYTEETLGRLHPAILFEDSGNNTLLLIGFLTKFGCNNNQIFSMFQGFPKIQVSIFLSNMRRTLQILNKIGMDASEIGNMVQSHALLLGSYMLKTARTLMSKLNVGKEQLRNFIQENPQELRNLKLGSKVGRLPKVDCRSTHLKTKFLMELGFVDEPNEMVEEALKKFRGSGVKLQERFDCLVEAGLDKEDVCQMVKVAPQILNISEDLIKKKIDFLINDLGYPLSWLVKCPSYLNYSEQRVKLRLAMYGWLQGQGRSVLELSLSTILVYSEKAFLRHYVKQHPKGLEVFQNLKRKFYSDPGFDHTAVRVPCVSSKDGSGG